MILAPQLLLLVFTILIGVYSSTATAWAMIAVIVGFVLSVITTFTILIANFCICQTLGPNTQDIEMRKGTILIGRLHFAFHNSYLIAGDY